MKNANNRIRIAIQKSGKLSEESLNLLNCCGIYIRSRKEQLFIHSDNFPLDVLLVRDDDISNLVADGACDFGIVGTNVLHEQSLQKSNLQSLTSIEIIKYLDFGSCRLSIATPISFNYQSLNDLQGYRIATSYPYLVKDFFRKNKISSEIITLSGSIEIAPRLGIADIICDLVSTGATLEANNLKEIETVFESQAVLIKSSKTMAVNKQRTAEIFQNRVHGAQHANGSKYIMLHAPKISLAKIVDLLPGVEYPTVMELQGDPEKMVVHALCREKIFWETMEQLKEIGASSILVLPVEKMMR